MSFHVGGLATFRVNSSLNVPADFTFKFVQRRGASATSYTFFGNETTVKYTKWGQTVTMEVPEAMLSVNFSDKMDGNNGINGDNEMTKSYLVSSIPLCVSGNGTNLEISTETEIRIMVNVTKYILGDTLTDFQWDSAYFPESRNKENGNSVTVRMVYWNNKYIANETYDGMATLGVVVNNGSVTRFEPNLTANAQHALIQDGAVGILNLFDGVNELNITSRVYEVGTVILRF